MPNYTNIYRDLILEKFPEKLESDVIKNFFSKSEHSNLEIIRVNDFIYSHATTFYENQRLKSYDKKSILKILKYQKANELTNVCVSLEYKLSRNTVAKWKKLFSNEL
ncbi:helix-turn-helix domain-containing protein [Epilithonimonas sp. UC225_85]|uniref:helix-turn-helix domain-containing protein n=1 Tax=Epilithonimonas sp. UC225_85 TaxID=3350167 RepID=UPI0036D42039